MSGLLSAVPFMPIAQGLPIEPTYVTLGLVVAFSLTAWVVVALRERRDLRSDPIVGRRGLNAMAILFLLVLALWYGTDALVQHDEAVFLYAGSIVAEGALPYERAFDNTGPLGSWFGGLAVRIGEVLGVDAITAQRLAYVPIALLIAVVVVKLMTGFGLTAPISALAVLALAVSPVFVREIASGPRPKMLVLLLQVLVLWALKRQSWLLAGSFASLAALAWQPAGLIGILVIIVAWLHNRAPAALSAAVGGVLPVALVSLLYLIQGKLYLLWEGAILWNVRYTAETGFRGPLASVADPLKDLWGGNQVSWAFLVLGIGGLLVLSLLHVRARGWRDTMRNSITGWAGLLCVIWVAWTFTYYQGVIDLFPFIPLAAIGLATTVSHLTARSSRAAVMMISLAVMMVGVSVAEIVRTEDDRLGQQRAEVFSIVGGDTAVSYNEPAVVVLTGAINPHRFFFRPPGLSDYLEERGETDEYLATLFEDGPVVVGARRLDESDALDRRILEILNRDYVTVDSEFVGLWRRGNSGR